MVFPPFGSNYTSRNLYNFLKLKVFFGAWCLCLAHGIKTSIAHSVRFFTLCPLPFALCRLEPNVPSFHCSNIPIVSEANQVHSLLAMTKILKFGLPNNVPFLKCYWQVKCHFLPFFKKNPLPKGKAGLYTICLATPLSYPPLYGLRSEALRPPLSEGLPFSG